jgi:hypothetical protein
MKVRMLTRRVSDQKFLRFAMWAPLLLLALVINTPASAQNDCSVSPPTGTCAASSPVQAWCAGNNTDSTCPGGSSWIGLRTSAPSAGSWTNQFEGLDAASIRSSGTNPRPQPDPNGGVGPTDSGGIGQYLEFSANYVQAFDRHTGNGILSKVPGSGAEPQPMSDLFAPGGKNYCANGSVDGIATYDRIDNVFVLANIYNPGGTATYYYCIGVSASTGSVPASNLEGSSGRGNWNVYAYSLNPAIPHDAAGHLYFPDYQRFGTWSDGYYVAWDLEDTSQNYDIVGFEVCKLDKADIIAGLSSNPPACYTYIPAYIAGPNGTAGSLIHTLLPADFEGNSPIPSNTAGEYFLAQVNPNNPGTNNQCTIAPCTSDQLAFWTWSGFTNGSAPTYITFPAHPYTPGCYSVQHPYDTICVPEPYGGLIDGLGDRLNYRLAYRHLTTGIGKEYLAVAQTVQEDATTQRTGIRYYLIAAGSNPTVARIGELQDVTTHLFASMPSVATDSEGDLGITFTVTGNTKHGSAANYDPSPFFIAISRDGQPDKPIAILSNSGASGQDETDDFWGEYVSVGSDPDDDLTFWAVDEYMNGNQTGNCTSKAGSGCTWATRVFTCKKGSGC